MLFLLKKEKDQINYSKNFKEYISDLWNLADLILIVLYLGAFIPMKYIGYFMDDISGTHEDVWKAINILIILLTFVKIN